MDYTEIIDYLNKPTDPALKEKLNQWLQADSSHQLIFNKIERLWELSGKEMETPDPNITIAWNNVQSRIQPKTKLKVGLWLRVAATILMIIAGSYWGYNLLFREAPNLVVITQEEGIKEVLLADGTKVFLNKYTELSYPPQFSSSERIVHLKGEAYFEVAKSADQAFIIKTDVSEVKVLGTSFNVQAYPDSNRQTVVVNSGRVAFYNPQDSSQSIVLEKDQGAYFDKNAQQLQAIQGLDLNLMAWRGGIVKFRDKPLSTVLLYLENYFNINIDLSDDKTGDCRISASFSLEDVANILSIIENTLDLKLEVTDAKNYTLKGSGCNQ